MANTSYEQYRYEQDRFDLFWNFLRSENLQGSTELIYYYALTRKIDPKILEETGKGLFGITSIEEVNNILNNLKNKHQKAALGHYLKFLKHEKGVKKWSIDYASHKEVWKLDTPHILNAFKQWLESKAYPNNPEAVNNEIKNVICIAKNENKSVPELVRYIESVIIYNMSKNNTDITTIRNFYDFIMDYGKERRLAVINSVKPISNSDIVKRNLDTWYNKLQSPYTKIILLYYKYCEDHKGKQPNRYQLEKVSLEAGLQKGTVRTYLTYFRTPKTQTGQIFLEKRKGVPLRILPEVKDLLDEFYKKVEDTITYTKEMIDLKPESKN